jgi:hypothetical protein
MDNPKRARSWKRLIRPRIALPNVAPVLYSTPDAPDPPMPPTMRPLILMGDWCGPKSDTDRLKTGARDLDDQIRTS